jgi:hypothetical protein
MKEFLSTSWYKIMMGTSVLITSTALLIYSVSSAVAKDPVRYNPTYISPQSNAPVFVRLSDDQIDKIIPKNEDGSINIRLSEVQMKALSAQDVQKVDIQQIRGVMVGVIGSSENSNDVNLLGTATSTEVSKGRPN